MKWFYTIAVFYLSFGSISCQEVVLIVAHEPVAFVQQAHEQGAKAVVVVATDCIAKKVRRQCRNFPDTKVYTVPLFSHSKQFRLYSLDRHAHKISLLPEKGARYYGLKRCMSLTEFCRKAGISTQSTLIVDWGNTGYFVVRYADLGRFSTIYVRGLSDTYRKRLAVYFQQIGRELL